jgi:hypothetical protein
MGNAAKKPDEDLEPREEEDNEDDGEDDDSDEDEADDDDDDDEEEEDPETSLAQEICQALRDGQESCVSAIVDRKKILLDLDDDSHWVLTIRRRD